MTVSLDHVAISARDPQSEARFLGDLLGLPVESEGPNGEFECLRLDAGAMLLFAPAAGPVAPQHVALRVGASEFGEVVARLRARNVPFGNDPEEPTNARSDDPLGGRGRVYFAAPEGHLFEVCA